MRSKPGVVLQQNRLERCCTMIVAAMRRRPLDANPVFTATLMTRTLQRGLGWRVAREQAGIDGRSGKQRTGQQRGQADHRSIIRCQVSRGEGSGVSPSRLQNPETG